MTTVLAINDNSLAAAKARLAEGDCVAIPTETVYGLAADATNGVAVARIFEMKGRPRFNPLICHVADTAMAERYGAFDSVSLKLAGAFWPGPLTLVVPLRPKSGISELATAGLASVGLRCPAGPARELVERFGRPLAAPSANRSGRISPTTAAHVAAEFSGTDLLVLDGGPCPVGIESTIVRVEPGRLVLLRPGAVTAADLEAASGLAVVGHQGKAIEAPGMMASHYAPDAAVITGVTLCPPAAALLAFGPGANRDRSAAGSVLNLSEKGDLREAAANLYAMLKRLDATRPPLIAVETIPDTGLGLAINDRLARAAALREAP
jgi:L-threonylcarbamoyladenylate synthase